MPLKNYNSLEFHCFQVIFAINEINMQLIRDLRLAKT